MTGIPYIRFWMTSSVVWSVESLHFWVENCGRTGNSAASDVIDLQSAPAPLVTVRSRPGRVWGLNKVKVYLLPVGDNRGFDVFRWNFGSECSYAFCLYRIFGLGVFSSFTNFFAEIPRVKCPYLTLDPQIFCHTWGETPYEKSLGRKIFGENRSLVGGIAILRFKKCCWTGNSW